LWNPGKIEIHANCQLQADSRLMILASRQLKKNEKSDDVLNHVAFINCKQSKPRASWTLKSTSISM